MSSALKSTTVEIANGNTRWVHNNGAMGFLKSDSNWDMYANNSGQIWAANYGWLHDYFFSSVTNCFSFSGNCSGNTGNCYNGPGATGVEVQTNCGNVNIDRQVIRDDGSSIALRTFRYSFNCNCNCACTCK